LCTPRDAVALGAEAMVVVCDQLAEASETYTALAEALTPVWPRLG
jgi:hypothetical protein